MQTPLLECLLPRELEHHKTGSERVAAVCALALGQGGLVGSESRSCG